ncbi:probable cation-transporting ATPase 13A5 isoform X1 [Bufo gargarizans]|uniref:probable cation-transporting ATPase 13A5 isoform X1 n=1 Tax=Bufo gargarizans TaxID=30331 RepID=UPI001CF0F9D3|nr:probable cation-transporting ATPase 13A5 isoform X1 [Bufo gargarizans]
MFQKSNAFSSPRGTKHSSTMTRQNILNEGQENEMELFGYKKKQTRNVLCIIGYIFTLGILKIIFYWKPQLDVWSHCVSCSLADADVILLRTTDEFKKYTKKKVKSIHSDSSHASPNAKTAKMETSELHELLIRPQTWVRYIRVQRTRYMWNPSESMFQKIGVLEENLSCSDIHAKYGLGLSSEEQTARQKLCGPNTIDVEITPILKLLFKEVLNPIYGFSVYSISIWLANGYFEFSIIILLLSIISLFSTTYLLRKHSVKLHNMVASHNNIVVSVLQRNGVVKEVESKYLVPGDVLIISEKKFYLPCDALLISGGCITNECMLTGESVPVTKVPLPNVDNGIPWNLHSGENNRAHMLYCGTEVIKTILPVEGSVKALVLKTGFNTAKGDLIRSILYPKPVNFKLHREVWKVISGLMVLSVAGIIYTIVINSQNGATAKDMVIMSLLMITLAIPVSLPPTLTTCTLYSQTRLKKQGIFCISPQRIIVCGQLNLLCFDKTGTLTEDCLDLWGIVPSGGNSRFLEAVPITPGCTLPWSPLIGAMASCHSLVLIDGKVHGDPLDMKMFEGTGWELEECKTDGESSSYSLVTPRSHTLNVPVKGFCIFYQFPFSSSLQRMTVITKPTGELKFLAFMKGAPEMIVQFCRKETVPDNFYCILDHYTMQGYRVIGIAYKDFKLKEDINVDSLKREEVENELQFLGFLIMENRLKSETKPVLHELKSANIRTVMLTGDNLQTACTVGLNSGMVPDASRLFMLEACEPYGERPASFTSQSVESHKDKLHTENESMKRIATTASDITWGINATAGKYHYAMSGKSYDVFKKHFPDMIPDILLNGTIFGRMTPKLKTVIIEDLQKIDYYVGMCGDGANDCGALKAAHAGISLSNLEASMASPFTSNIPNIECVPKLLKEGRNAFVTAICLFKFIMMYTVSAFSILILLFWKRTIFGNYQYMMQDFIISITVMLTMSLTGPYSKLAPYRPAMSLLSPPLLLSLALQISITVIIQTSAFFLLQQQPWYSERHFFSACLPNETSVNQTMMMPRSHSQNFMTTTLWPVSAINLVILEFVFSKGRPFRKPMYTNYIFCTLVLVQLAAFLFMLFADFESVYYTMELVCTPYYWRFETLGMLIILFVASYSVEAFVYNRKLWLVIKKIFGYKSKSQYKKIQRTLEKHTDSSMYKGIFSSEQQFPLRERDCV